MDKYPVLIRYGWKSSKILLKTPGVICFSKMGNWRLTVAKTQIRCIDNPDKNFFTSSKDGGAKGLMS